MTTVRQPVFSICTSVRSPCKRERERRHCKAKLSRQPSYVADLSGCQDAARMRKLAVSRKRCSTRCLRPSCLDQAALQCRCSLSRFCPQLPGVQTGSMCRRSSANLMGTESLAALRGGSVQGDSRATQLHSPALETFRGKQVLHGRGAHVPRPCIESGTIGNG